MDTNPLVSIIVVTYNSEKYVLETLNSIKEQTYDNIELIITDDCSTDKTVSLCYTWIESNREKFQRVQIVESSQNTGISANCNRGLAEAQGEWLKFIAGDDALVVDCLRWNIDFAKKVSCLIVFSEMAYFKKIIGTDYQVEKPGKRAPWMDQSCDPSKQYAHLLRSNFVSAPSVFIKRTVLDLLGGFDERFPMLEDYPLWLRATKMGLRIFYLDKVTVNYREGVGFSGEKRRQLLSRGDYAMYEMKKILVYQELPFFERRLMFFYHLVNRLMDRLTTEQNYSVVWKINRVLGWPYRFYMNWRIKMIWGE